MRKESIIPMDPISFLTEQVMALQEEIKSLKNLVSPEPTESKRIYLLEADGDYTIHGSLEEAQAAQNNVARGVKGLIRSFKDETEKQQYIEKKEFQRRRADYFLAFYVEKGRITGPLSDPKILAYSVKDFPGATYTTFKTRKEMDFYHKGIGEQNTRLRETFAKSKKQLEDNGVETFFYVDGSCDSDKGLYSSGFAMEYQGYFVKDQAFTFDINKSGSSPASKVAELQGAMLAVIEAKRRGLTHFSIVFDCMGVIEEYLTESEDCQISKNYYNWMKRETEGMTIEFLKAKSHIGIEGNEMVDQLVKEAIDSPRKIIK